MGMSVTATLAFGFSFEEGFEFPWSNSAEDAVSVMEEWWRKVNGFVNPVWNPYTEEGNYKPGVSRDDPRINEYFNYERKWDDAHPVPAMLVESGSESCARYILAVPKSDIWTSWDGPLKVERLPEIDLQAQIALVEFCKKYEIETDGEPAWWLCAYFSQ